MQYMLWNNAEYEAMRGQLNKWTMANTRATHSMKVGWLACLGLGRLGRGLVWGEWGRMGWAEGEKPIGPLVDAAAQYSVSSAKPSCCSCLDWGLAALLK